MKYRADIDGLRAIAVLSVIFFHAGFTTFFSHGYMGVDIFFVISGFLITTILYNSFINHSFSLVTFYERRVRRILPVFFIILAVSLTFTFFYYSPRDFREFCNSLYSTIVMGSNFFFWRDDGYFAAPSHIKPLLHTWSLGVEEQFYIFFPLLMWYLITKKVQITRILTYIFAFSFLACIIMSFIHSDTAFYLLPFRAWELLIGSIYAVHLLKNNKGLVTSQKQAQYMGIIGLLLILFSITGLIIPNIPFPSFLPLFACIGAILCIDSGRYSTLSARILSTSVLRFIGLISYSLYLWHWIILAFLGYYFNAENNLSLPIKAFAFLLMFTCSILTYYFVEQPIRKKHIFATRKSLFFMCIIVSLGLVTLTFLCQSQIIKQNFPTHVMKYLEAEENTVEFGVFFGDPTKEPTLLLLGDSHAGMFFDTFDILGKKYNVAGIAITSDSPFFGGYRIRGKNDWQETQKTNLEFLSQYNIEKAVISSRWALGVKGFPNEKADLDVIGYNALDKNGNLITDYVKALEYSLANTIEILQEKNASVYIILPVPEMPWRVPQFASRLALTGNDVQKEASIPYSEYLERQSLTLPILKSYEEKNVQLIDPTRILCDTEFCYATANNESLYLDKDHLSKNGAQYVQDIFLDIFNNK